MTAQHDIQALGYVGFSVSDLDAWMRFAVDLLGLQPVQRDDGAIDLRMDSYATRIRLIPGGDDDIAYAGWEVRDAQSLDALADRLAAAGTTSTRATEAEAADRCVQDFIRFTDPEGLVCEAFYGPLQRTDQPFVSPLGVTFKTGRQGIGHIVLIAKNAKAQERWWCDVVGFRLSDYITTEVVKGRPVKFTFMRCNGRHHSLALTQIPLPKKLQHFMIEVQSIDDVGRALYRCLDAGMHISLTLGRHSNDDMLSFYPMTPSGFDLEYGWGGLVVEDETWHVLTHDKNSAWGHRFQRPPRLDPKSGVDAKAASEARPAAELISERRL
jgi:2,3-dihydroxybiphenyl 1,2-dioxygenase